MRAVRNIQEKKILTLQAEVKDEDPQHLHHASGRQGLSERALKAVVIKINKSIIRLVQSNKHQILL